MNRLYVVEPMPSITGSVADHRLPMKGGAIGLLAAAIEVRVRGQSVTSLPPEIAGRERWINAVANDLLAHRGSGLVIAGESQPGEVHAAVQRINDLLGNAGKTFSVTKHLSTGDAALNGLVEEMNAGAVGMLVMMGANPVYTAPADLHFSEAIHKVPMRVHHGLYQDETSRLCHWHVTATHELESWSDATAFDGTPGIIQPLIAPLYDGRSAHALVDVLKGQTPRGDYDTVRDHWRRQVAAADFEAWWRAGGA